MFRLAVQLCRYLFLFYIACFLWNGATYLMDEREIREYSRWASSAKQSVAVLMFHATGYLIMAYAPDRQAFDNEALLTGLGGLAFLVGSIMVTRFMFGKTCPLIWNGVMFLLDIGFVMLQRLNPATARRQVVYACVGLLAALLASLAFMLVSRFERLGYLYLPITLGLLSLPFFIGDRANGSLNWVTIGSVRLQPSEIAKFFYIFYLAYALRKPKPLAKIIAPAAVACVSVLILVAQRDLGGALIFYMTFLVMGYISTGKLWLFFGGLAGASAGAVLAYQMFSHVQTRVFAWLNPWADPYDKGLQILQSMFAIGTWGTFGSGLTLGAPRFVPVVASDMIFSAVCEEFGGLFGLCVIGVFVMIFYRGANISLRSPNPHLSLLAAGFTGLFAFQAFLIIGGAIKFIPLTGVTLPFVSAGGSSVIVSIIMVGILQRVGSKAEARGAKKKGGYSRER